MRNILTIFRKELKEVLRDRKTLIFMLVLPIVVIPLLFDFMVSFATKQAEKAATETLSYAIFGGEHLPGLAAAFAAGEGLIEVDLDSPDGIPAAVQADQIQFGIVIPEGAMVRLARRERIEIEFYFNNASLSSRVRQRAGVIIEQYSETEREKILTGVGFDTEAARLQLLDPVAIAERATADMQEVVGERAGGMLPYLFLIFCFMGAMYPAIDMGAGEKERGTLETLLLAPVPPYQLVIGKFLVVFTTGVTAALLCLTSIGLWLRWKGSEVTGELGQVITSVTIVDLVLIGVLLVPPAAIFASVLLALSIYSKSFKEANSYASALSFLIIIPAVLPMLPGVELDLTWALIPVTNVALAVKEIVKGTMSYEMLPAIIGSSILVAAGLLYFCAKWFEREDVLFRE